MNNKTIKTKDTIKDIKQLKKKDNHHYFEKKNSISLKDQLNKKREESEDENKSKEYAVNKVTNTQKRETQLSAIELKRIANSSHKKNKNRKIKSNQYEHEIIKKKHTILKSRNLQKSYKNTVKDKESHLNRNIKSQINTTIHHQKRHSERIYHKQMKHLFMMKKKKQEQEKSNQRVYSFYNGTKKTFTFVIKAIKKMERWVSSLIHIAILFLIITVIILFIGVFSALSNDSGIDSSYLNVSEEVLAYSDVIHKYAEEYDMNDYIPLIQAVMMQESGGIGTDPMQSSECFYNTKYPKKKNGITDPEYSIDVGIHYLSDNFKKANVKDTSDMDKISLALQGYNFGSGYIKWAIENFGGYTKANAKVFSDEMKAKNNVKVYGDPDYASHVLRYYHIGNGNIVLIAKSQIGNVGGKTYWSWYGFNSHVEWCACFVSWCANESGDLNINVPKFARVEDGISWYKSRNRWMNKNYIPTTGNIIFFDCQQDNDPDHVGIVEKVENGYIYTIEGNSSDECRQKKYSISNKSIYGYGK